MTSGAGGRGAGLTLQAMAQTKPTNSRAMAVTATRSSCARPVVEAFVQALLCLPGNESHLLALMLLTLLHRFAHQGPQSVMPRRFGQDVPAIGITAFGNTAQHAFVAAGVFTGSQSEKVH